MSPHIAPHRWADLWAGKVEGEERVQMERHAKKCSECARVRQRVTRASDSFATIRTMQSPEASWDTIRARVHWSVSTAKRAVHRPSRAPYAWLAGALAAGIAVASLSGGSELASPAQHATAPTPPPPAPEPVELVGLVSRASGEVMLNGLRPQDLFARQLTKGARITTGDGRVDVQFGDKSAFALGPRSTLELRRFDADVIELAIDGTLDVAVAPRAAGQRFLVEAGARTVEVRGTQFRVSHDATATSVACRHGLVNVRDGAATVEVAASRRLHVTAGAQASSDLVAALTPDEATALAQSTPLALPLWDPAQLVRSSAPLEIATVGRRDVRVDGLELGLAPLRVRVMPGRHTVEAADPAGRYRRIGWVDVAASPQGTRLEVPADPPATGGIKERRSQLRARLDQPRARCMRSIAKSGLTGSYVQIEIAVDPQGSINFLNVLDTDLPSATASCVRESLSAIRFPAGTAATWREKIDL